MKLARREVTVEHEIVLPLAERIVEIEKELAVEWERYIDDHMVAGVPRGHIQMQAWGEITKLANFAAGSSWDDISLHRLQHYSRILRWLTKPN
jgi:hypothetical protein